jgi:chromosome segregation protein
MNVGGSMTGGSTVNTVGVLSRANELEQLEGKIKTCTEQHTKIQREHSESLREKTAADYELSTALVELRTAEEDVLKQELETSHHEKLLLTLTGNIETLTIELKTIEERLKNNSKISETLKSDIEDIEKNLTELKDEIEEAIIGQEKISVERERVNGALAEYRTKIAALEAESDSTTKLVAQLSTIRDEMFGSRERQLDTINKLKSENELILNDIQKNEHSILSIAEELNKHKEILTKLYKKKNEIEAKSNSLRKSLQDRNEVLHNLQRKCDNLLLKKNNLDNEERTIHDKLWDNYELSPTTAISAGTPIENINTAKSRLNAIKRELFELGEPNIGAIKEYERVSVRYNDLTTQREDVVKAKTDLLAIIEDITSHMRNIFTKEFANINKHFEVTFKELFGGGHASLELEDVDDVLNCGIEIKAQPPGKQLRTLSLLSGGEQAFVAIAIYFAILTVRPPPFVVMDEIDAALDDANVIRFADYMRFMSDKTQMVVISHKRGAMEEADVLYGITMQEHGVSNVICIDLNEAEKHIKKA